MLISSSHVLIYKKDKVGKKKPATICFKNTNWRQKILTKSDVLCKDLLLDLVWTWNCNLTAVERGFYIAVLPSCHNWPPAGGPNPAQLRNRFSKLRGLVVAVNKFQISLKHCLLNMTKLKAELRILGWKIRTFIALLQVDEKYTNRCVSWYQRVLYLLTCVVKQKFSFEQKLSEKLFLIVR